MSSIYNFNPTAGQCRVSVVVEDLKARGDFYHKVIDLFCLHHEWQENGLPLQIGWVKYTPPDAALLFPELFFLCYYIANCALIAWNKLHWSINWSCGFIAVVNAESQHQGQAAAELTGSPEHMRLWLLIAACSGLSCVVF